MASPQVENGYIKIASELFEQLCKTRISGEERQIFDVILRKTYGWEKKRDAISLSQFERHTGGMKKPSIIRARNKLLAKKLIKISKNANGETQIYEINKNYDDWKPLKKKLSLAKKLTSVSKKANKSLAKKLPTINTTIDTITKDIGEKIWKEFKKHRTKIKKPLTPYAEKLIIKKLLKYKSEGLDINEIINLTIEKGWQDVKWAAERIKNGNEKNGQGYDNAFLRHMAEVDQPGDI